MKTKVSKARRHASASRQLVPVEVLLSEKERREFRIAALEEGSSMRDLGRMMITSWLSIRKMASRDLDEYDEV